jgi:hypothetical protein
MKKNLLLLIVALFVSGMSFSQGILDELKGGKTQDSLLRLKIVGNGYSDETIILFMSGSTECFDSSYDAYKLMGSNQAPQLYCFIFDSCTNSTVKMAVDVVPQMIINRMVQLRIRVDTNTQFTEVYSIEATEKSFPAGNQIWLEDTEDDVWVDLLNGAPYSFIHSSGYADRFRVWFYPEAPLALTTQLEGAYDSSTGEMSTAVNGLLPLNQPFNTAPWNYTGTESVTAIPNADVVDWVLVDFREAASASLATSATSIGMEAGFLLKDGSIVSIDGVTPMETQRYVSAKLFAVLHFRNHLDVINGMDIPIVNNELVYDFTTAKNKAFGSTQVDLGGGIFGVLGGDSNADGTIDSGDATDNWLSESGSAGYLPSDVNYDGQSNNLDKNDVWNNNVGVSTSVPN